MAPIATHYGSAVLHGFGAMPSLRKHDVVILYNDVDLVHAKELVTALERLNVRTWFADRDVPYGGPISSLTAAALEPIDHVIVLIGANGLSGNLRDIEIAALLSIAANKEVKIIQIFVDRGSPHGPGDPPHYLLAGVKGIDCRQTGISQNKDLRKLATQILGASAPSSVGPLCQYDLRHLPLTI